MPQQLVESLNLSEATQSADTETGVLEVEFITPGWGSSGYYSAQVVEAAAPLFAVGTHMYFDHPTEEEDRARPVRSVRDLAAVIVEAGKVDKTTGGIRGKVRPLAPYKPLLTDKAFAENVGLSIRGSATDIVVGEAEGRTGPIIEGLADIASVDFVTRAGRGGKVLQVLESARPEVLDRAIARGVAEATADERRQQLSDVVRTAYAGEKTYAYVRDFDESTVWFEASAENERSKTWQQAYTVADDDASVSLTGERTEVRPVTKYVPVTRPGSTTNTTEESEEDTMPQIEEARLRELEEASGRVPTLEAERDTATARAETAERQLAERDRTDRARQIIAERARENEVQFTPLEERGLLADLPLNEGQLDEATFTTTVNEQAAAAKVARGAGSVRGFGGGAPQDSEISESDIDTAVAGAFGRTIKGA